MAGALQALIGSLAGVIKDAFWSSVTLLLPGNGTNGAQNNTFLDASTNNFTITRNGNTTQGTLSPFTAAAPYSAATKGGSMYFDGTGDYLSVPDSAAFDLGSGDGTIEAWIYPTTSGVVQQIINQYSGSSTTSAFYFYVTASNKLNCSFWNSSGAAVGPTSTGSISSNTWTHVAVVRNSGTTTLYINGTADGTATVSGTINNSSQSVIVGADIVPTASYFTGYISNLRFVKGTAVYTANFTPSTAPLTAITNTSLLLLGTNAGIIDNAMLNDLETVGNAQISTTQSKFGGSSIAFDGTGDYLKAPGSQIYAFGTGDYTIETWVRFSSVASAVLVGNINGSGNGDWAFLYNSASAVLRLIANNVSVILSSSSWTPSANTWYHVALTRSGTTYRFFVDGTLTGSGSDSTNISWTTANSIFVGSANDGSLQLNGYIDDLRITKGVARYTANFTPPTAAFPTS